jgi:methylenetetrahydrofolate reductase (NADPH)
MESAFSSPIQNPASSFAAAMRAGEFLITAEVAPPKGSNPAHMLEQSLKLKDWTHAINITDGSRAVMRMSSFAAALLLQKHGIEPVCQTACRD